MTLMPLQRVFTCPYMTNGPGVMIAGSRGGGGAAGNSRFFEQIIVADQFVV
jgi:hypothetical protein